MARQLRATVDKSDRNPEVRGYGQALADVEFRPALLDEDRAGGPDPDDPFSIGYHRALDELGERLGGAK